MVFKIGYLKYIVLLFITLNQAVAETPDYQGMFEQIEIRLNNGLQHYRNAEVELAKTSVQGAYFEVFENLEGPIRINVSAQKNYSLEREFVEIRKMIIDRRPLGDIEDRIRAFLIDLKKTIHLLKNGHQLIAEPSDVIIDPFWLERLNFIESKMTEAISFYKAGKVEEATRLIKDVQFAGFKNSLMETSIRRHHSQTNSFKINQLFSDLIEQVNSTKPILVIEKNKDFLVSSIRANLDLLPIPQTDASLGFKKTSNKKFIAWIDVKKSIINNLEEAVELYENGKQENAISKVQDTYFEVFEESGMEEELALKNAELKNLLESHFSLLIAGIKKGNHKEQIQKVIDTMEQDLNRALELLDNEETSWSLFLYSLMILLREGFEAILIVTAIISYLYKVGQTEKVRSIYGGCLAALVASVLMAVLVKWVFSISAASQEILEGFTMLFASVVLFSVSYWLISKAQAQRWNDYIKSKVDESIDNGRHKTMWLVAFLAVFREGAETVLFYQALILKGGAAGVLPITLGFVCSALLLFLIYFLMRKGAMRLPIKHFFIFTGSLLYLMAFVFSGQGVMELIEGKIIQPNLIAGFPTISSIGVYPYWQTTIPQILIMGAAIVGLSLHLNNKKLELKRSDS